MARNAYVKTVDGWEQIATSVSAAAQGLAPIVPSGATNGTVSSSGVVSFSGAASVNILDAFSINYPNYLVVVSVTTSSATTDLRYRYGAAGSVNSSANYTYSGMSYDSAAATAAVGQENQTSARLGEMFASSSTTSELFIANPNAPVTTHAYTRNAGRRSDGGMRSFWMTQWYNPTTSFTDIQFLPNSGTITGSVQVYGYSALANPLDIPEPSPNYLINGGMDFWQRGTSGTPTSLTTRYVADRWECFRGGFTSGLTISRQTTGLTGIQYSLRAQRANGNTSTQFIRVDQPIETINSLPLAGKTVTLSFWARMGANYSGASSVLNVAVNTGTGTDQNLANGFTGSVEAIVGAPILTTSWQRFSYSGKLGSSITQVAPSFTYAPVGTASTNDWFEIAGVQLEEGALATDFRRAGGDYVGEQEACFRYYYRAVAESAYGWFGQMHMASNVLGLMPITVPVNMRTIPHTLDATAIGTFQYFGATGTLSSLTLSADGSNSRQIAVNVNGSGFSGAGSGFLRANNSATAYIGVSAEL